MAEKKSWRDYSKNYSDGKSTGKSTDEQKTGSWRDYSTSLSSKTASKSSWRDYASTDTRSIVGNNIVNRVNSWLQNHNSYISDYQKRYEGRKYSYEDSFVSDSADWLDQATQRKNSSYEEADAILSYIDQHKGYLDDKWVNEIRQAIVGAKGTQSKILEGATKDNEYWSRFGSEDLVKEYGSAEEAYKTHQRYDVYSKKYSGQTYEDIQKALGTLEEGEEKEWLTSYGSSVDYNEKLNLDTTATAKEIDFLENQELYEFYNTEQLYYDTQMHGTTKYTQQEIDEINAKRDAYISKYGSVKDLVNLIDDKRAYLSDANSIQELARWSTVTENTDFSQNSQYVSNVKYGLFGKPEFTDDTYAYVNNPTVEDKRPLGAGQTTARDLIDREHSVYASDTPTRNRGSSYERDALDYMEPEEIAIYNYYYATEGEGKAREYLDLLVNTFQARKDAKTAENVAKVANEHPILSSALSVGTSIGSGFEYIEDVIEYGADKIMGKDAKLGTNESALVTNAVRNTVSEKVDWEIGNWDAFDFLYNTTMSGVDSLASTAFGGLGGTVLGLSAAAQGTNDALNRGMSDGQAFWNGLFSGVFEGVFESLSIGNFNKLKETAMNVGLKNIDKTVVKTIAKNLGKSMLVNASEEMLTEIANITYDTLINGEFANYTLEELFEKGEWKNALNQVIESGASGALMGFGMSGIGNFIGHAKGVNAANEYAVKNYGKQTAALIQEGLESDVKSDSYKLATKYQAKEKAGKTLTGQQIRNLLAANQEQITPKDMQKIQKAAEQRLTTLGQTKDIQKVAELATKRATGQKLTRSEKSFLANSEYGSRVANELLPENIASDNYSTAWAEEIGTKQVNAAAYNKKAIRNIIDAIANAEDPNAYKPLESRVDGETLAKVSDTGKSVIRATGEEIDLTNPSFKQISDEGVVLDVNGKPVRSNEIDYDSEDQGLAINSIGKIEHITPAAASALYAKLDMTKPVMGQLNGMDEAFTYGFYNYSEADLEAGLFTGNLTKDQLKDAYNLGRYVAKNGIADNTAAIKKMRTAADALAEKNAKEGKETPKSQKLTITYNHGNGIIEDIETAEKKLGKLHKEQRAGIEVAKILHQMGIGTSYEFFKSEYSKTLKDKEGNPLEVFINDEGQEEAAYAGIYLAADGKIRINLNAYSGTKGLTLNALSHELTHFIKTWSLDKYTAMAEFLVKSYGEKGVSMHQLVLKEQARLEKIRKQEVGYGEAYDEVVANAFNRMLEDGKVMERIAEIRQMDKSLGDKIIEGIKKFIKRFMNVYQKNQSLFKETEALMEMKEVFEQLQNMFAEALVEASDNFQASLIAMEAGIDIAPVENSTQYSYQSLAEAAGFEAVQNDDGTRSFVREGHAVSKVTVEDIENSPIGAFINFSLEMGDISDADAKRQKEMFAKICTMACKTNDFAMTMQFVGSAVFTGMKANADKQYGTTYDFPSICTKTQAVIDAMSAKMMSLGRGLKTDEIVKLYKDVFASGNPVPCPECYVFSRWIGIGGLLDNIKKYQDYYGDMAVEDVAAEYRKMRAEVAKFAEEQGISFGKAKGALTAKLTKEFNKLTEKIEKAENQGEKVKPVDRNRLAELEPMMNTVKGMTWLENVYFADSSLKKVNPNFRVPDSVLFDLNNGEAFATKYKEAWAFRTTQGAGYGKAITPYAEARLGEGVLVTNNTTNAIKGKAQGSLNNYFLNQKGKLDKQSRETLKKARLKQKIQAFIGGQRFQSTSDARYENASDYLLAALEMQAMGGMVQVYTKVDGAVPAFSAWGFSINQSLMPLNGGLDENGNVQDTPVGGMKREVAFDNRKKHETAGTITIGVNDNHIRAMFKQLVRDFIIPYHASGGKADVVAEFRRIQEGNEAKGKAVRSTDYSRTQSDKILSDEVLRWQGKTEAQIQRIHEIRDARIAILTGGKPNMTVVRSNRFLSALYDKLNGGEWDGVKLAKSKVESQIFPNEFWDQTVTYEESAKITKDYLEYCEDLGFLHRFSGTVPSNGKLVPVNGYDENGERVQLTDLAYKYDENGNKTAEVEEFFWKVLTDRRMYDNNGNYLAQKVVTLNDTTSETVTGFAKNNQGRQYDKAMAEALAQKILKGEQYSSQETDLDTEADSAYDGAKKETEQEVNGNEKRKETRESFLGRAGETSLEVGERGSLTFGFRQYSGQLSQNIQAAEKELKNLGIPVVVFEHMEGNKDGTTTIYSNDALSIPGVAVFIHKDATLDAVEIVGHEGYHYLRGSDNRIVYREVVAENIEFSSKAIIDYQKKYVGDSYFSEDVVFGSKEWDTLMEELFAYITGHIHAGDPKGEVHEFLRDYDAVKAAWDDLIKKQATQKGKQYSSQQTDLGNAPTFYSQMGKVVEGMKQEKFGASSVISMLRGRGVKAEEIRWSGIQAFLDGKKSVTKQELLDFINSSMLHIEETILDGSKGEPVKLPNNYRLEETENGMGDPILNLYIDDELVDTFEQIFDGSISSTGDSDIWAMNEEDLTGQILSHYAGMSYDEAYGNGSKETKWDKYTLDGGDNYRELLFKMPGSAYDNQAMEAHWGDHGYGVLAHARIQDFNTFIGKMLFIEEIQSDWHNAGQKEGYRKAGEKTAEQLRKESDRAYIEFYDRVESMFNGHHSHYNPALMANLFEGDADTINFVRRSGFTDEEMKYIKSAISEEAARKAALESAPSAGAVPDAPFKDNYHEYVLKRLLRMAAEEGYDSIGWTTADIQSERWSKEYAEGYRIEYDQDIPKFLKKYGNQWGTTVGKTTLDNGTEVWSMAITDSMQKSVLKEGQAMYSTQQTDNITDRDMLANAFETISKSSDEYEMIQDYKRNVNQLNKLERDLDEVNQEIRKIRFGTGQYDGERLKLLESKANRLAKEITKYDKRLLNMEASAPLRRVIQQERKKEAQRTKDHVKEIQQNKKLRAEQTELRHKIRKAVRDLDKILNRGNKKQNVKEDMKGFVSKALELADYLFTDHISNDELIRRGITVRMTPKEAALVKETEDILTQLYDKADSLTDEEFTRLDAKRKSNLDKLRDLLTAQRNERLNTPVYDLFNNLVTEYASLKNSSQDAVRAAYNVDLERLLRQFMGDTTDNADTDRKTLLQNMRVADMTTKELQKLLDAYKMVLTNVRDANKVFVSGKLESIDKAAEKITWDFAKRKTPDGKVATVIRNLSNKMGWDYEKLYYALDRIGSEAFTELVMNIADSENIVMQDVMEAAAFRDEMVEKYDFNNWDVNKEIDREFLDNTGKKFKLTLGQLMALYAYSRREGAWDHIEYGGFVFGEVALTNPRPADSYKLSKAQCEAITNLLTKEQKGYAVEMQKYLSEVMGEKGNDVSMLLYGIKMFGEKNYFPIHIAGQFKAQAQESQAKAAAGFSSMTNAGFTHAQNPNAKAPFVLEGFNEIWADHVNEMSRYHGTVPALEDMRRVMNRSSYSESGMESMAIKQLMENSFGKEAVEYFDNLYREANSGAITDKLQKKSKKLLSLFRKNSVAYSLSVLIQQPAAMVRAYDLIDRKYFGFKGFGTLTSGVAKAVSDKWTKAHTNAYNEMLKYAPGVTMAKEIGGFDTHTGGSIRSYLLDTNKKFSQKWKTGTVTEKGKAVLDTVDNNAIANLPNLADKIAWIEIWNACKRETVANHKNLVPNSEEFMQAVGDRFTEVIRATQVYDSMFAKSPMLKSKNLAVQYLVSFMNEPNTVANMAEKAVRDATRGDWKSGARTAVVVVHSIIFTNVLKSMIYALRDDDEDETYIEKYIEAIAGGMMDDFNALNYIPLVRDAWSVALGYDVERADTAIVADAVDALGKVIKNAATDKEGMTEDELVEFDKKVTDANWKLVESLAAFFGIPVKNVRREIEGVMDHARIAHANAGQTTALSAWDKVYEAVVGSIPFMSTPSKQDKLYDAIISGDKAYLGRIKSTYKTEDAYQSAVRKALRDNDSRIQAAAQARYNGNTEEYKRIFREIQNEGRFSFDDIMSAINTELSKLTPDKVTSDYTASGYVEAIAMGNTSEAQAMKDDIIATKVANGKTEEEAEKEFASSVATGISKAYSSGLLDDARAEEMLVEYAGMDEEDAVSRVGYWAFCEENPKYDYLSESNVNDYHEFAEPADISVEVYAQFITGTKGLTDIKDKWGDVEVTKREQVLEVIDSLPLTWQQKDALYLAAGYSENKIWDVPW